MPNNLAPSDTSGDIKSLKSRLTKLENLPQLGNSSILNGSVEILNATGQIVMIVGVQPDGSLGIALYNPATGAKTMEMGALADGSNGLATYDQATGTKVLQVGQQPGSGLQGLGSYNPAGAQTLQLGEINASPSQYGLAVLQDGSMQQIAGAVGASAFGLVSTAATSPVSLGGPSVTANVGPSGLASVTGVAQANTSALNFAAVAIAIDGSTSASQQMAIGSIHSDVDGPVVLSQIFTGLSAGAHIFELQYFESGGATVDFYYRTIVVTPL
jgi:hypothetical protein